MPISGNGVTFKWVAGILMSAMLMIAGWLHYQAWAAINHNAEQIAVLGKYVQTQEVMLSVQKSEIEIIKRTATDLRVNQDELLRILHREFGK
jgi:hypothetical protein